MIKGHLKVLRYLKKGSITLNNEFKMIQDTLKKHILFGMMKIMISGKFFQIFLRKF